LITTTTTIERDETNSSKQAEGDQTHPQIKSMDEAGGEEEDEAQKNQA
jgi:hypothetical protein